MDKKNILQFLRNGINNINLDLIKLLKNRQSLSKEIAKIKIENEYEIKDTNRENKISIMIKDACKKFNISEKYIYKIFNEIIDNSVNTQINLKNEFIIHKKNKEIVSCTYLGPKGSYSQLSLKKFSKNKKKFFLEYPSSSFEEIIINLENKKCDYAILPIENKISGYINKTYNYLKNNGLYIIHEVNINIKHCLLAIENCFINDLKNIYSHEKAIIQCNQFLKNFPYWNIQYSKSTSDAMKNINQKNDKISAVIGNELGGKLYGLKPLVYNISNQKNNQTRFIVVSKKKEVCISQKNAITSILLVFSENKNFFEKTLIIFRKNNLFISRIFTYIDSENKKSFFLDINTHIYNKKIEKSLFIIKKWTHLIKILGCYSSDLEK